LFQLLFCGFSSPISSKYSNFNDFAHLSYIGCRYVLLLDMGRESPAAGGGDSVFDLKLREGEICYSEFMEWCPVLVRCSGMGVGDRTDRD